jgi:hypothetical protein
MKNLFFVAWISSLTCAAQHTLPSVTGRIVDSNQNPIPGVSFQLKRLPEMSIAGTAVSDSIGIFQFEKITTGNFAIHITMVGFVDRKIDLAVNASVDLGVLRLEENVTELKEVSVNATPIYIDSNPGSVVYNVSSDPMAIGKSLSDLATFLPGVSQTGTGTLTYNGENGVVVLVNGRKSNINPADVLRNIPSSNVNKIELFTGADPRFASSGGAATINIVLKKNKDPRLNGNVNLTTNTYGNVNGSISLSKFKHRANGYIFLNSDDQFNEDQKPSPRQFQHRNEVALRGGSTNSTHHSLRTLTSGIDLYIDSLDVVTIEHTGSLHADKMDAFATRTIPARQETIATRSETTPSELENTLSINHQKNFRKKGQTLESELSGTIFALQNNKVFQESQRVEELTLMNYAGQARTEIVTPLKNGNIRLGLDVQSWKTVSHSASDVDSKYTYKNSTIAVYVSNTIQFKPAFSVRPGLRVERVITALSQSASQKFDRTMVYPSLNVLYKVSEKKRVRN